MRKQFKAILVLITIPAGATNMSFADNATKSDSGALGAHTLVYIGTYTGATGKGIYKFGLNPVSGETTPIELAAEVKNPSFLAVSPDRKFLYAVSEISNFQGAKMGGVSSFSIDPASGRLSLINQQPSGGRGPCHVTVSPDGHHVGVANYGNGSIALLPVQTDGSLTSPTSVIQHTGSSVNPKRQNEPHAHSVNFDSTGNLLFAADLGIDRMKIYRVDAEKHTLAPNDPPEAAVTPGSGPRHFAFHPNGKYAYVINEMGNTITTFGYNAGRGTLTEVHSVSTIPADFKEVTHTAEVRVHPSGKFVYGSNRGHDSIAIFKVEQESGKLTSAGYEPTGGKTPRNFGIDPSGQILVAANQDSDNVVLFRIDTETGALKRTGEITGVGKPVCVVFLPR